MVPLEWLAFALWGEMRHLGLVTCNHSIKQSTYICMILYQKCSAASISVLCVPHSESGNPSWMDFVAVKVLTQFHKAHNERFVPNWCEKSATTSLFTWFFKSSTMSAGHTGQVSLCIFVGLSLNISYHFLLFISFVNHITTHLP